MPAHLTSVRSSVGGSALHHTFVADEIAARDAQPGVAMPKDSVSLDNTVEAPQLKNEILAMVAHELRGPLTPLRFASQMIRMALADRPDIHRLIDMIDRQVSKIERLAQDLMDATRVEQDGLRLTKANIEVVAALADACAMTAAAAAAKGQASPC